MTMRFDRFLKAAEARPPAMVLQVSSANGLGIIRDLAANDVPLLATDSDPRALGLHSRLASSVGGVGPWRGQDTTHERRCVQPSRSRHAQRMHGVVECRGCCGADGGVLAAQ